MAKPIRIAGEHATTSVEEAFSQLGAVRSSKTPTLSPKEIRALATEFREWIKSDQTLAEISPQLAANLAINPGLLTKIVEWLTTKAEELQLDRNRITTAQCLALLTPEMTGAAFIKELAVAGDK